MRRTNNADQSMTLPQGTPAGDYYLAVSTACGGANLQAGVPYSASGQMWDFTAGANNNVSQPPNGDGNAGALTDWGRKADCSGSDNWNVRITLTGACYAESAAGPNGCVADVDNGTRTGTPDEAVTIDDLLYFLERFEAGC